MPGPVLGFANFANKKRLHIVEAFLLLALRV